MNQINVITNKETAAICKLWLQYIKDEQLLSINTYNAYSIDLKYFFKFLNNHKGNKVTIKILENLKHIDYHLKGNQ